MSETTTVEPPADVQDVAPVHDHRQRSNLVSFEVANDTYGVDIKDVREIRAWSGVTPLPNTADFIRGVMNLRGAVIPIVDLRARFGQGMTQATDTHVVVVVAIESKWVGLLVDAVSDIVDVTDADIQPSADFSFSQSQGDVLRGVAAMDDTMVALVNTQSLLDGAIGQVAIDAI